MPKRLRRARGALEREVLAAVAGAGRPVTAGDVVAEMDGEPAYTTVMTTLARLYDKGALSRSRAGRAYAYEPAGSTDGVAASLTARQMRRLLEARADRATVLARFVAELGPDDERLLASLLEDSDRPTAEGQS